jgi:hemerythrin-like domain-containing protein
VRWSYLLLSSIFVYLVVTNSLRAQNQIISKQETEKVTLTEDLMREHGVLNRVLLIYEEIAKRINNNEQFPTNSLEKAVQIIRSFIEDYHEKLEEDYIFPIFEHNKKELKLIRTLKNQHRRGRKISAQISQIIDGKSFLNHREKRLVKNLVCKFIVMYRPHEAREDTVLFPQIHSLISKEEYDKLSKTFEEIEQKLFGKHGFNTIVNKVATIEKKLGIYNLQQFTP